MPFRQNIADCLFDRIGGAGARTADLERARGEAKRALNRLLGPAAGPRPAFLALSELTTDRPALERLAGALRGRFRRLFVFGTGGSSLGGQAIIGALAPHGMREGRSLTFLDNIDPASFEAAFDGVELGEAAFLAISKSGATAETVAQTLLTLDRVAAKVGAKHAGDHFAFIVEPGDSPLRRLAARLNASVVDHDPRLGGRFSVLSPVGLLPALFLGLDAWALRAGAAAVLAEARRSDEGAPLPVVDAAVLAVALMATGLGGTVLMAYGDALQPFCRWWQQLIAESLGKDGRGPTPMLARGATDQHSQLQLYLAGPADKSFTILGPMPGTPGASIDPALAEALGIAYLGGRALDVLFAAEAEATAAALAEAGRPVRRIALDALDAATLGGLFMHFMLETVLIARLIGVDPFDQPAVERGKALARQYLERRTP